MSGSLQPYTSQLLAQISPELYQRVTAAQNNPQASDAELLSAGEVKHKVSSLYREELSEAIGGLTTALDLSLSTIDHKYSEILKESLKFMQQSADWRTTLETDVRNSMSTQLKMIFRPKVDFAAIEATQQLGITTISTYKQFRDTAAATFPPNSPKHEDFVKLKEINDENLKQLERDILSVPDIIFKNPGLTATLPPEEATRICIHSIDEATHKILADLHNTLTQLTHEQEALSAAHLYTLAPISEHQSLLQSVIQLTKQDDVQSLTTKIEALQQEEPELKDEYAVLRGMLIGKYPTKTLINHSQQLLRHVCLKVVNIEGRLKTCLQSVETETIAAAAKKLHQL